MTAERWRQIETLFAQAVECPTEERQQFLDRVCEGDPSLQKELASLLASDVPDVRLVEVPPAFSKVLECANDQNTDMTGRRIGPYRIIRLIGHGGMGAVFLGTRDDDQYEKQRGVGVVSAYALAGSEENARGHLVVTAPTGGSAGVLPAVVYVLGEGGRKLPQEKIREGLLAAVAIGYLCKHNATLAAAEGGCQAEIGVASAMGAALIAQAHDLPPQVVANAAESSLEHHLGMTCDPVAGYVQIPCIERCAYGAVKAWIGFMIASNEIPANRRVDFDTTVSAMALTAKEMNSKYKETSEGGLAVSVTLC